MNDASLPANRKKKICSKKKKKFTGQASDSGVGDEKGNSSGERRFARSSTKSEKRRDKAHPQTKSDRRKKNKNTKGAPRIRGGDQHWGRQRGERQVKGRPYSNGAQNEKPSHSVVRFGVKSQKPKQGTTWKREVLTRKQIGKGGGIA